MRLKHSRATFLAGLATAVTALVTATSSAGAAPTPPGPAPTVTAAQLAQALTCSAGLAGATRDPVLLTPAFSTGAQSFAWNYGKVLPAAGIPTCTLSLPDHGFGDLQQDSQYDVAAVRKMVAVSGRKVVMMGHEHGPLDALWALTFWPDLPADVSAFVSLETPYNGTTSSAGGCRLVGRCAPADWQIAKGSAFLAALARRPLPAGPTYTSITTLDDELITPQPVASHLNGATNVVLQDVCPGRIVDHFSVLADAVAYAVVRDALDHPGPLDLGLLPANVCKGVLLPGIDLLGWARNTASFVPTFLVENVAASVTREPATAPYALG